MSDIKIIDQKATFENIKEDLLRPIKTKNWKYTLWIISLVIFVAISLWCYGLQLKDGLVVTGMRDYVSWGIYISTFVFFVAVALVGMLISAVVGLLGQKWITPISRIAEMIALAFVMMAGLIIIVDMGRPDRLLNVFIYFRYQSPIFWDVTVVTTYVFISALLLFLPMLPDLGIMRNHLKGDVPKWKWNLYNVLSLGWIGTPQQYKILHKTTRVLLILVVPVALAIHTVTSWLSAMTLRPGWDSTIFGPYYVTGAFVAGSGAVLIAMYFIRRGFHLEEYITEVQFDKMGKLMVLVSLVYLYFNINEFIVPAYKMKTIEAVYLKTLFAGSYVYTFWFTQIFGLLLPIILGFFKKMRKPFPLMLIGVSLVVGAWFKRLIIIVPALIHSYLPQQNYPANFHGYEPTGIELTITLGTIALAVLIVSILVKLFPVMSIWEIAHEKGVDVEKDL
ncbi:MAG: polysulfide reductase [Bacteroidetes bacterium CG2_30_33_31]|nr:MAG: polysulfide reductase [Bacteroidetes bacterium CG2_30_33_31]